MTKLSDAAKAAVMFKHGGREFRLSPLELGDFSELERWIETLPYEKARRKIEALGEVATPDLRDKILEAADEDAKASALSSQFGMRAIASLEGVSYLLYLCLRREQPDVTRADAARIITIKTLEEWKARIDKVSGLTDDADETRPTEGAEPPKAPSTTP